ncbi:heterokaryon incompatibility [Fusarium acutatum]|uniref:Heterokaryon incompatibility n=1 Tax=Fusarium acutatum TaxID=78861 RepID=A0A8H4N8A6_9HYPO|nr:heterokaryon incompatibility [Fusarium acutatum]
MDFISRVGPRAQSCDIANLWKKVAIRREIDSYIEQQSRPQATDGDRASESKLGPFFCDLLNEDALLVPSPLITGISNILQRDYWHRIWILQEVALAKEAHVVLGTKSVSLELFDATFTPIWYCMRSGLRRMHPEWYGFCKGLSINLYEIKSLYIRHHLRQIPTAQPIGMWGVRTYCINHYGMHKATGRLSERGRALSVKGDANILHRFGCRVDEITNVMDPPEWVQTTPYEPSGLKDPDNWFRSIAAFTGLGSESSPGEDYIWRTITRNTSPELTRIPPQERTSIIEGTYQEIEFIHHGPLYNNFGSNSGVLNDQNRTLFKTSKGMLGLGHLGIEVGDIVSLIWGVSSPIILRLRRDGGFYFCGDAYVDGITQGEFLENGPVEEEFCIY